MFLSSIWRRIYRLAKILAFFGFLFLLVFIFETTFKIKEIRISSEDLKGVQSLYGKNLVFLDTQKIKNWLEMRNPTFKSIELKKNYPNTLIIYAQMRKPLANIFAGEGFLVVDKEAIVIQKSKKPKALPTIKFYQTLSYLSYSPGDRLDLKEINTSLNFLSAVMGYLNVVSVDILSSDMIRLSISKNDFEIKEVLISSEKDLGQQIYELEELLKYFKEKGIKNIEYIDLRFNKPVYKKI